MITQEAVVRALDIAIKREDAIAEIAVNQKNTYGRDIHVAISDALQAVKESL